MGRITRRRVLKNAAAVAVAGAVRPAFGAATGSRIVTLSDVHIGDNTPTVWYQQKYHEPYLSALFDHVIANAGDIRELVILGDFVDFWTYPPERRPPSFAEIAAANPNILGPDGKLSAALTALQGRVTYVPGNHDMTITQADLALIGNRRYQVRLHTEENYFPLGADRRLLMAHGHRWTMFNCPDATTRLAPLPVGHFATRAFCHMLTRKLKPGQTVADLVDQGQPNGVDFGGMLHSLDAIDGTVVELAVTYASNTMGLAMDAPVVLPSGATTTLAEARSIYRDLWASWERAGGGGRDGELEAAKAAAADIDNGTYLAWFAQRAALQNGAELVVYGHTHEAVRGLKDGFIDYLNTGFDCASMPDMPKRHFTFAEIDTGTLHGQIMQVTSDMRVIPYDRAKIDTITPGPTFDFSTYVTVDNSGGAADLLLSDARAKQGHFVVPPPARIARGQTARFWIQDYPGGAGSAGSATYQGAGAPLTLSFACPTGVSSNSAAGAPFRARTASADPYGALNHAPTLGHPFFVQFVT
jgi:UDP-2,3-diacylglucosamine pyrophosphatase LpxH